MRITLSGAQCTGKSTLIDELKNIPEISDKFKFKGEILRDLRKQGIKINEQGTNETQLLVLSKMIENATLQNTILDRCALDSLVYTMYLYEKGQVSLETLRLAEAVFENIKYDICFYLPIEFDIVLDGVRSENNEFRNRIDELFREVINLYHYPVINLEGSIQERVDIFKQVLEMKRKWEENAHKEMIDLHKELMARPRNADG